MELDCDFCCRNNMDGRIVAEKQGQAWYAFVLKDPHIFGHIILTVDGDEKGDKYCERNIWGVEKDKVLSGEIVAARDCMRGLKEIPCVERVYLVVAGESTYHHHYHLIPRYKRHPDWNDKNVRQWKERCELKEGDPTWRGFYNDMPRKMLDWCGFQYLGELEHEYNDFRTHSSSGERPELDVLKEMADKVRTIIGLGRLDDH